MVAKVSSFFFFYNILPRLSILYKVPVFKKKKYGIHPRNPVELKVVHRQVEILKKEKEKNYTTCALHLVSGRLAANFLLSGFQ